MNSLGPQNPEASPPKSAALKRSPTITAEQLAAATSDPHQDCSGIPNDKKRDADWSGAPRVQLACFYCRAKRIRCSGERPVCSACLKASAECEWPAGRRPKRTRREMEEARRQEAAQLAASQAQTHAQSQGQGQQSQSQVQAQMQVQVPGQSGVQGSGVGGGGSVQSLPPLQNGHGAHPLGPASILSSLLPTSSSGPSGPSSSLSVHSSVASSLPLQTPPLPTPTQPTGAGGGGAGGSLEEQWIDPWSLVPFAQSHQWQHPNGFAPSENPSSLFSFDALGAPIPSLNEAAALVGFNPSNPGNTNASGVSIADQSAGGAVAATADPRGMNGHSVLAGFLHDNSPDTNLRLVQALENHAAYIKGDPGADDLELYYYRFSGSTAIQPGIQRMSLKLQRRRTGGGSSSAPEFETVDDKNPSPSIPPAPLVPIDLFDENGFPHRHIWEKNFNRLVDNLGSHFPSMPRKRMKERFDSGTMSAFLAICQCALGARFNNDENPLAATAPFVAKAQELVTPLLHLPTHDTAAGLLMLGWSCYGQNSDSGLWQYVGMALRMAQDLGVYEESDMFESEAEKVRTRLLFWNMFISDRIVAFQTGRPATVPEEAIEVPLPENEDFLYRDDDERKVHGPVEPIPFTYTARFMVLCGRISNLLNGRRAKKTRTLGGAERPYAEELAGLQARLISFYAALPEGMRWSVDNFKHQHDRGHGPCFLTLHVWCNAVLALLYHPDLLKPIGAETPFDRNMPRNVKMAIASARQIVECMVYADLVSAQSYIGSPIIAQPLYVAATALMHEMQSAQSMGGSMMQSPASTGAGVVPSPGAASDIFHVSMTRQHLTTLLKAVMRIEPYWAGVSPVVQLLQKRCGITLSPHAGIGRTFISMPDTGLLRRFNSDRDHSDIHTATTSVHENDSMSLDARRNSAVAAAGHGLAPHGSGALGLRGAAPADGGLGLIRGPVAQRGSISGSSGGQAGYGSHGSHGAGTGLGGAPMGQQGMHDKPLDTMWISDLLNGYSVSNMSFAPADSFDLARLVALAPGGNMEYGMGGVKVEE